MLRSCGSDVVGRAAILSLIVLCAFPRQGRAGAWTLEERTGQAIVTGLYSGANESYGADGRAGPRPDFEKGSASALVEYGLTDAVTLLGSGEIGSEREGNYPFARPALSQLAIGVRVRMYEADGFVASVQLSGLVQDAQKVGDEATDTFGWTAPVIEPRALLGYGFTICGLPAFVNAEAGYRAATGEGPDETKIDLTAGIRPLPDLLVLAQSFSTLSAGRGGGEDAAGYSYHKAQLSAVYDMSETWSLQVGGFATVAGTDALKERGLITALWYRF
ncbi:hypothetical protein [Aurantimonas sp. VKM B-3413]|uniref:hypothetical protein n=1 Tax=Aurantimonas sp. VKM B-3413 TaxID=2779401 RepID=UPI001E3C453D|nr:hypothetical protein [Aurantimonas sp. VKM B-3413]MCB8840471.1 hypothetical protein [Aurantimonas sp. VKM B-3413]